MSKPPWLVRAASAEDGALLTKFCCADPKVAWQLEVEAFIQTRLLTWVAAPGAAADEPRALLVFRRGKKELVGVVAHERVALWAEDEEGNFHTFYGTKLQVVAVERGWQGRSLGVERASDVVMSAAMKDISARVPPRPRVIAMVHRENARSLALCRRYGFTIELAPPDPSYRLLATGDRGEGRRA